MLTIALLLIAAALWILDTVIIYEVVIWHRDVRYDKHVTDEHATNGPTRWQSDGW
jgi:hypothetical protein